MKLPSFCFPEVAESLEQKTGRRCLALGMDVRQVDQVEKAVDQVIQQLGNIHILVNNAAGNFLCDAENLSYNAFKNVLNIDAIGTYTVSRVVFLKSMKQHGGSIINITATLHWNGELFQVHAGSAKAAIEAMARHLCNEWGRYGVRINNVAPGPIANTVGFETLGGLSLTAQQTVPIGRFGHTDDIANMALFLSTDAASFISGATIVIDGGAWMKTGHVPFAPQRSKL